MRVEVILIQQPDIDFPAFLSLGREAMGYSLAAKCDASGKVLSDAERFLSCLDALHDRNATPSLRTQLLPHVSFSVAILADSFELLDIAECASGMPFIHAETKMRGVDLAVITGRLSEWRDAVLNGTARGGVCKAAYCKIVNLFVQAGLDVWKDYSRKYDSQDRTQFLIEDKRNGR
jgi:hypothetical protein